MNRQALSLVTIAGCVLLGASSFAATIPAGTTLVVRTTKTVASQDRVGKEFTAEIDRNVVVDGTVLLHGGTKVLGKVESSSAQGSRFRPFTLNLTAIVSDGREVPIVTTGAFKPESVHKIRRNRLSVSSDRFVFPVGSKVQFRLAKPVSL